MQSKLLFLLAILMGVFTTAIFFYSSQSETPEPTEEAPMVDVVTLAQDIEENQKITEEDLQFQTLPKDQVHPSAIKSLEEVKGKFATADMVTGELLLSHRLKSSQEEKARVSRKVTDGHRAVSIGVDIVRSVSNLIQPEDYVDVIFTYETKDETKIRN
ncbi:Flp pilus assembly protein CpaB [Piscibacillus salipiscarius]|uniref:Flp pilus assembly protein CpaB n=1 Tax=Piscibacillus salipiscarius TaxID=299480 RepID=UPI0006D10427|nr:Flp pilus assembly protein CpaB [Piscibacillus salipiscarius]